MTAVKSCPNRIRIGRPGTGDCSVRYLRAMNSLLGLIILFGFGLLMLVQSQPSKSDKVTYKPPPKESEPPKKTATSSGSSVNGSAIDLCSYDDGRASCGSSYFRRRNTRPLNSHAI
ncbi:hypothetical protein PTTG_12471 [Puccinia triticina 1-1 BBBD Race 1]|uniref:Uncharacterized protein n=2 Tax=Puccinia triticina TaxID=208348 RepID=A0A180GBD7_PUCT1|nr:uncharacterized protein PtA15_17A273 [Puccinia triticina]OAV89997.1 hypothetical protein PTTG_12471 [Puccinia triticina 1-1 BBBD Race 1]WAQ92791.1 hypothetical protein PtA15_17A273 [Puccinia triticina]WAR63694.1 hypothetical protein PtB15_17B295 [Puccinia triticina]